MSHLDSSTGAEASWTWSRCLLLLLAAFLLRRVLWRLHAKYVLTRAPRWYRRLFIGLAIVLPLLRRFAAQYLAAVFGDPDLVAGVRASGAAEPPSENVRRVDGAAPSDASSSDDSSEDEGPPPFE